LKLVVTDFIHCFVAEGETRPVQSHNFSRSLISVASVKAFSQGPFLPHTTALGLGILVR
jgi:hypothetical protein